MGLCAGPDHAAKSAIVTPKAVARDRVHRARGCPGGGASDLARFFEAYGVTMADFGSRPRAPTTRRPARTDTDLAWGYRGRMLSYADVARFWAHPVHPVKQFARSYLELRGDKSAIVADEWYEAMERFPPEDRREPPWEAIYSPKSLARRALELNEVDPRSDHVGQSFQLRAALYGVDRVRLTYAMPLLGLLPRTAEMEPYRARLRYRLAVTALPPEQLLSKLIELCDGIPLATTTEDARRRLQPWTDALAVRAHPGEALEALTAPRESDPWWSRIAAVYLVSAARYEPAIPQMLQWLEVEPEECMYTLALLDALESVDTDASVAAIGEAYHRGQEVRIPLTTLLCGFRRPSAEALLLELLDCEQNLTKRAWLIKALCELGTTEGLDRLRPLKENVDYGSGWIASLEQSIAVIDLIRMRDPAEAALFTAEIQRKADERTRQYRLEFEARRSGVGDG